MKYLTLVIFLLSSQLIAQQADETIERDVIKIAFGSCSDQKKVDDQLWQEINNEQPDLWVWLGDNVYSDGIDMEMRAKDYALQKSHPGYQKLLTSSEVIGIWDDHDFGVNDGGSEYSLKMESKEKLFEFLDVSKSHPARTREGANQSYLYKGQFNVKVILLDARYFRDSLKWENPGTSDKKALINRNGGILGESQWKWLERQLTEEEVDLFLICSGIQVIPTEHRFEKWANFPKERSRLLSVFENVKAPLVILSGDRHMSEVSKLTFIDQEQSIYEFTSSSLSNPWGVPGYEPNQYRVGEIVFDPNFAMMELSQENGYLRIDLEYIGMGNKVMGEFEFEFK